MNLHCPYCDFHFKVFALNADYLPDTAPVVCEGCGEISLFMVGVMHSLTAEQTEVVKRSPAWAMLEPAQKLIKENLKKNLQ